VTEQTTKRTPNFFIVGAPKCGTTALYSYLKDHSQIFLPELKEPHFFCTDFPEYRRIRDIQEYEALFQSANEEQQAVGEASVFYLFSQEALRNIFEYNPKARIIVMLRKPVEMAHSLHSQLYFGFRENEADFETAWNLQDTRLKGKSLPEHCLEPKHLQYRKVASYSSQIAQLFEIFPREQVKVLFHDDLKRSVRDVYCEVLDFLGVEDDGREQFDRVNVNKVHRSPMLARWMMRPPFPFNYLKSTAKHVFGIKGNPQMRTLYSKLTRPTTREALGEEFEQGLVSFYQEDVVKLEELLDQDLSHWAA
jgi:hypothetical protein